MDSKKSKFPEASDKELMELIQAGDDKAFRELVIRFQDRLMNFVGRIVTDKETSEEIVQETFLRIFNQKMSYTPQYAVSTWIYTIALNLSRSELRKRKLRRFLSLDFLKEESDFELADSAVQTMSGLAPVLQKAIEKLPQEYKTAFILCDIQRLPYQQIAEVMRVPVGTVKSRINRARSILREKLKPYKELQHELSRGIPQTISLF
ncbi:MAG: sigma-70 family RNA polymerase sigma factor [Candidatus Zixiibacteriota bacterium]|nr:MAG: sigma-70 family RNA polymerase sigma factor [candidate division Zixibacteria bacterium]